ncbi:MAG: hypothetical protein EOP48_31805 [Sphingobacteriales bacterium]|nr:MAG: hypothetical protein EOP48_31805 [Sphingobacteriales bacterium]
MMEHRFVINYTLDDQPEALEVITTSASITPEEARRRIEEATKPYGKTDISNIKVVKTEVSENIDTDPETSASE